MKQGSRGAARCKAGWAAVSCSGLLLVKSQPRLHWAVKGVYRWVGCLVGQFSNLHVAMLLLLLLGGRSAVPSQRGGSLARRPAVRSRPPEV